MSGKPSETRCIFCWSAGPLTREHVFSSSVRKRLIGVGEDAGITWKDGSSQLWAGETMADRLNELTVRAVCAACNNTWMQQLDDRISRALLRWTRNPNERLGRDHFHALQRYLTKVLWVIRVGEDWTTGAWLRGEGREPEFIPLSLIQDGKTIRNPTTIESGLALRTFVGGAQVSQATTALIDIPPIPADGIKPTQKVGRVNAGLIVTFREVGLRLWVVLSGLNDRWQIRWPKGATSLSTQSRFRHLPTVRHDQLDAPVLEHRAPGPILDVEAMFSAALANAQEILRSGSTSA